MGAYIERDGARVRAALERVYALFPVLAERRRQKAGTMSGGEQQMLAIGRALMTMPRLILLDEPSLGLSPKFVTLIFEKLVEMKGAGYTLMLVEQNATRALAIADRGYVLELGRNRFEGPGASSRRPRGEAPLPGRVRRLPDAGGGPRATRRGGERARARCGRRRESALLPLLGEARQGLAPLGEVGRRTHRRRRPVRVPPPRWMKGAFDHHAAPAGGPDGEGQVAVVAVEEPVALVEAADLGEDRARAGRDTPRRRRRPRSPARAGSARRPASGEAVNDAPPRVAAVPAHAAGAVESGQPDPLAARRRRPRASRASAESSISVSLCRKHRASPRASAAPWLRARMSPTFSALRW